MRELKPNLSMLEMASSFKRIYDSLRSAYVELESRSSGVQDEALLNQLALEMSEVLLNMLDSVKGVIIITTLICY